MKLVELCLSLEDQAGVILVLNSTGPRRTPCPGPGQSLSHGLSIPGLRISRPSPDSGMIIVTGARSRGLGRAVAERLISSGREVLSLSRTSEGAFGDSVTCDVSDYEAVAVAQSLRKGKREIEGLVNAAGTHP